MLFEVQLLKKESLIDIHNLNNLDSKVNILLENFSNGFFNFAFWCLV